MDKKEAIDFISSLSEEETVVVKVKKKTFKQSVTDFLLDDQAQEIVLEGKSLVAIRTVVSIVKSKVGTAFRFNYVKTPDNKVRLIKRL